MGTCSQVNHQVSIYPALHLSGIMQFYAVILLVAAASATHPSLITKHNANTSPVLNLNHKNVHIAQQVPVMTQQIVNPGFYSQQVLDQHQIIKPYQAVVQKQVLPQMHQVLPYTGLNTVVQKQVLPQVHQVQQVLPYTGLNTVVQTPQFYFQQPAMVQTEAKLTEGYVAATHGAVHTAPLPLGPSNDGFFASHHINLPNVKA